MMTVTGIVTENRNQSEEKDDEDHDADDNDDDNDDDDGNEEEEDFFCHKECEVGGQFFDGNSYFKHTQGCTEYLCTCFCNGTYTCPAERANTSACAASGQSTVTDVSQLVRAL